MFAYMFQLLIENSSILDNFQTNPLVKRGWEKSEKTDSLF